MSVRTILTIYNQDILKFSDINTFIQDGGSGKEVGRAKLIYSIFLLLLLPLLLLVLLLLQFCFSQVKLIFKMHFQETEHCNNVYSQILLVFFLAFHIWVETVRYCFTFFFRGCSNKQRLWGPSVNNTVLGVVEGRLSLKRSWWNGVTSPDSSTTSSCSSPGKLAFFV